VTAKFAVNVCVVEEQLLYGGKKKKESSSSSNSSGSGSGHGRGGGGGDYKDKNKLNPLAPEFSFIF
jgi:hypothetical protein